MSFSEKVDALNVVSVPEATVAADEGRLTFPFVLRVDRVCVVPVVLNIETEPVERGSELVAELAVFVVDIGSISMITFVVGNIRSLSACRILAISLSALVIMQCKVGSHQASFVQSRAVSVKILLSLLTSITPCHKPFKYTHRPATTSHAFWLQEGWNLKI